MIESKCPNSDFSLHDFTNWNGCYCITQSSSCYTIVENGATLSSCLPIVPSPTIYCGTNGFLTAATPSQPAMQTIITPQNTNYPNGAFDSLTNFNLQKIPSGVNQVVRLGCWHTNYETASLTYAMYVDTNISGLFVYSYAAVLNVEPSHTCSQQAYFLIRILDANGNAINNPCGTFVYVAGTPGTFVNQTTAYGYAINWFNWQTVGMSLKPYHGQNIKIQFVSADCSQGGHFGYAYFYAYCLPRNIAINYCPGSPIAILSAPSGFKYKWLPAYNPQGVLVYAGGDTTQSMSITGPQDSSVYKVVISSLSNTSCSDTLRTILVPNIIHSNFTFNDACVNVPVDFNYATTTNTPIYSWYWDFGNPGSAGNHMNMGTTVSHTYTTPGTYPVTLTDSLATGCPKDTVKYIHIYANPIVKAFNDSVCQGDSAKLVASGASTYLWSDGYLGNPHKVAPMQTTSYVVTGTSTHGCQDSTQATAVIYPSPSVSFVADTFSGCAPITVHFTNYTDPSNCTYKWEFGDNQTSTTTDPTHTYPTGGSYTITLTATSTDGCKSVSTSPNLINVYFMPHPDFSWTPHIGVMEYPVSFTNKTIPVNTGFTYTWNFGDNTGISQAVNPSHIFTNEGAYSMLLVCTSDYGCIDSIRYEIQIVNDSLTFPNIITPNGDGHNDYFVIKGLEKGGYPTNNLSIFNRWGKKIYDKNNYTNDFDGNGLPDGVYYYIFKAKGILKEIEHKGSLEILR